MTTPLFNNNKKEEIRDDVQKFQNDVESKINDAHAELSTRINKFN